MSLSFQIRSSKIAGKGAFAIRPIAKGDRLIEYTGERIPHPLADERYDDEKMKEHHTFLFSVSSRTVIDASVGGNESRFINHSCDPNCEAVTEKGRVYIEAIRPIAVGEELHYDYGYERSGDEDAEDEKRYKCLCGTAKCRGTIMESKADFLKRKRAAARKKAARKKSAQKKTVKKGAKKTSKATTKSKSRTKAKTKRRSGARR